MSDIDYDDYCDGECWNCGGEGRVNHCIDGCCVDQDNIYCEYCSKRCDICNQPTPEQVKRGDELRQILADALSAPHPVEKIEGGEALAPADGGGK